MNLFHQRLDILENAIGRLTQLCTIYTTIDQRMDDALMNNIQIYDSLFIELEQSSENIQLAFQTIYETILEFCDASVIYEQVMETDEGIMIEFPRYLQLLINNDHMYFHQKKLLEEFLEIMEHLFTAFQSVGPFEIEIIYNSATMNIPMTSHFTWMPANQLRKSPQFEPNLLSIIKSMSHKRMFPNLIFSYKME